MIRLMTATTALLAGLSAPVTAQETHEWGEKNADFEPAFENQTRAPLEVTDLEFEDREIVAGLEHPWAIEALPDGAGLLVTERPGRLVHVTLEGEVSEPISGLPEIFNQAAGDSNRAGLLDVKIGPYIDSRRRRFCSSSPG